VRSRGPHPCQRLATSYHVLYRPSSIAVHWCWQCLSQQVLAAARTKEAAAMALRRVQTSGSRGGAGGRALTRSGSRPWAAAGRRSCRWCPAAHGDTPLSRSAWRGRWKLAGRCSLQHACSKHSQAAPTLPEAHWLCHVGPDSAHARHTRMHRTLLTHLATSIGREPPKKQPAPCGLVSSPVASRHSA